MYERSRGQARLRVTDGAIAIGSLARVPGFASGVDPVLVNSAPGAALPQATKEMVS
jgi:hypothetical protein